MATEKKPAPPSSAAPRASRMWMLPAVAVGVLAVAILGMYLWERSAVREVERRLTAEKAQVVAEKAEVVKRAGEIYLQERKDALSLFAMPLAWAVRREVNAGNFDQVDQYFTEVVKRKGFGRAVFATPNGAIKVSSDRKYQGRPFETLFPAELLTLEQARLIEPSPGHFVIAIPILGLSERQGVVAIDYSPEPSPIAISP